MACLLERSDLSGTTVCGRKLPKKENKKENISRSDRINILSGWNGNRPGFNIEFLSLLEQDNIFLSIKRNQKNY